MTILVAHRGNTHHSHGNAENTIAALDRLAQTGCSSFMEIDVRLTSDRRLVCWHDHDVWLNGGKSPVMNTPYQDIKKNYAETCLLEEMLEAATDCGIRLVIELKNGMSGVRGLYEDYLNHTPPWFRERKQELGVAAGNTIRQHLEQHRHAVPPLMVTSYQTSTVLAAREAMGKAVAAVASTKMYLSLSPKWEKKIRKHRLDGMNLQFSPTMMANNFESLQEIRRALPAQSQLTLFTINDTSLVETLLALPEDRRPDAIITDIAGLLHEKTLTHLMAAGVYRH